MINPNFKGMAALRYLESHKLTLAPGKTARGGLERVSRDVWMARETFDRLNPTNARGPRWVTYGAKSGWKLHTTRPSLVISCAFRAVGASQVDANV